VILSEQGRQDLAWDRVCGYVADRTRTPMGRASALALAPLDGREDILARRDRILEMMRVREEAGRLPLEEVLEPAELLARLGVEGTRLGGEEIHGLLRLLAVARELRRALAGLDPEEFPRLGADWSRIPDLDHLLEQMEGRLTPTGQLEDHASPELHRIRSQVRTLSERLTSTLEAMLRDRHAEKVLRDDYITLRNNRFVLPVRTDAPFPMEGIVHGSSGTGQTLFIEPLETVAINNELVRLKDEEAREEDRILRQWSAALAGAREEIAVTGERIAAADLLEALAGFSRDRRAVPAEVGTGDRLEVRGARHPVLESTLGAQPGGEAIVPLDLTLEAEDRVLVISGPNTGGKTVALKTVGLLTLMAHAGLPVPAAEASFPLLGAVLTDIGDHQSIQASLSTFSSHVRNLASMIGRAGPGALVLLDEVGTGTDPAEGAALAIAVLDRLRADGARVVATTHHGSVKVWAFQSEGVASAACEFDEISLRPTYRLLPGVAGASSGLEIAERLGMAAEVMEEARRRLDPGERETERHLLRLRSLASDRERALEESRVELRRLRDEREEQSRRAEKKEETRRAEFARELERIAADFRKQADRLLARVKDAKERRALERVRLKEEAVLKRRLREEIGARSGPAEAGPAPEGWSPAPGERVRVLSLGREGTLRGLEGREAEVLLGRATFRVGLEDLRPAAAPGESARQRLPAGVTAELGDREPVSRECRLIGHRVEEGRVLLDKFLDDAVLAGHDEVRVVHGHGSGRLRAALRELLDEHPQVRSWRPGRPAEGGDGATVVRLRD
jgi:DNA mismatch repair protein MutS2